MFGKDKKKEVEVQEEVQEQKEEKSFGEKVKQYGKIALCCIVLLAAAVIALMIVFREKKAPQAYFYVNSEQCLYTATIKKPKKTYLCAQEYPKEGLLAGSSMGAAVQFSADGKYLYYLAAQKDENGFDLYVQPFMEEGEIQLLDKDVADFAVTKEGKIVYIKSDNSLYVTSGEEFTRLSMNALNFYTDDKGKNLLWVEPEESGNGKCQFFYVDLALKKDSKKLQGGVDFLRYVSDDLSILYFEKDGNLYRIKKQGEKEKIASDIEEYYANSYDAENDSFYYTAMKDGERALYYFDGKDSSMIHEKVSDVHVADGTGVLMYTVTDGGVKLYLVNAGAVSRVDLDEIPGETVTCSLQADESTETIYFLNHEGSDDGILYAISYAAENAGMVKEVDTRVGSLNAAAEGSVYYMKDYHYEGSTYQGDLYCNQELIAEDAAAGLVQVIPESDKVLYYTDWNAGKQEGTLMRYQDGKNKKIAEKVCGIWVVSDKQIFVYTDSDRSTYTLSYFNGKKVKQIAEDVVVFLVKE